MEILEDRSDQQVLVQIKTIDGKRILTCSCGFSGDLGDIHTNVICPKCGHKWIDTFAAVKNGHTKIEGQTSSSESSVPNKSSTERVIDFHDFDNRFIGYVCIDGDTIYIPAIMSKEPNKGHLTDLIEKLKKQYKEIRFTAVISDVLVERIIPLGFKPEIVYVHSYEEDTLQMVWRSN
jgi:predicted RNA-binding Zn-ribbon protein involved in translation (DUF1610 family)